MSLQQYQDNDVEALVAANGSERQLAVALYELGLKYATGHGVERNLIQAHKWLNLASVHGSRRAVVDRDEVARELSGREISQALKLAREWNAEH